MATLAPLCLGIGREAPEGCGLAASDMAELGHQGVLVAAGGLADDEAARVEALGEGRRRLGSVGMVRTRSSLLSTTTILALPTSQPVKRVKAVAVAAVSGPALVYAVGPGMADYPKLCL